MLSNIVLKVPVNSTLPPSETEGNYSNPDPRISEDCLFLDVFVPEQILASAEQGYGAPVLVWFYGGGYTLGYKNNPTFNPAGLLAASGNVSSGEVIFVAMNYRLGAFGFSSGPTYQAEGGTSNLGLHDQRFALEWVQSHISKFGGDPKRVTVFGESAGGGSIIHQITAYGGSKGPVPFQQAVPQSPGYYPFSSNLQSEDTYQQFLNRANCSSLAELRALSSEEIILANYLQITASGYGTFTYNPVVDSSFVPQQPSQLLAQGRFDKNVRVMVGHNSMEGPYFTPPSIEADSDVAAQLRYVLPYAPQKTIDYVTTVLYPTVFDGTYPYTSHFERASFIASEIIFTCNTNYLSTAFANKTYSYLFAVAPGFHGQDVPFTFYSGGAVADPTYGTVARALQDFITSFAISGRPHADGIPEFRMYGNDTKVLVLNTTAVTEVTDSNANARCAWWQKALYY